MLFRIVTVLLCFLVIRVAAPAVLNAKDEAGNRCKKHQYFDFKEEICKNCTVCSRKDDTPYQIKPCGVDKDTKCSPCKPGWAYNEVTFRCARCCSCVTKEHVPQEMCWYAGYPVDQSCFDDEGAVCLPPPTDSPSPSSGMTWKYYAKYIGPAFGLVVLVASIIVVICAIRRRRAQRVAGEDSSQENVAETLNHDRAQLVENEIVPQRIDQEEDQQAVNPSPTLQDIEEVRDVGGNVVVDGFRIQNINELYADNETDRDTGDGEDDGDDDVA